jgi:transposase-like protein
MKTAALELIAQGVPRSEVCERLQVNPATLRTWLSRANSDKAKQPRQSAKPKVSIKVSDELNAAVDAYNVQAELTRLAYETQKPKQTARVEASATTRNYRGVALRKIATRANAIDALLVSVIVGHSALVWYDCGQMWGIPGVIGGGVTFLIVLAALLLASDETKPRTSDTALWFVFFIDVAAWFVHYPTFKKYADIGNIETGVFAGFLCACSFAALYLFRDSKLD